MHISFHSSLAKKSNNLNDVMIISNKIQIASRSSFSILPNPSRSGVVGTSLVWCLPLAATNYPTTTQHGSTTKLILLVFVSYTPPRDRHPSRYSFARL